MAQWADGYGLELKAFASELEDTLKALATSLGFTVGFRDDGITGEHRRQQAARNPP